MTIQVDTKNLGNKHTLVQTYNTLTGYEKYDLKSYRVDDNKKDEFVKSIKKQENNSQIITVVSALSGLIIGAIAGYKIPASRIDVKPYVSFYAGLTGFVLGALGSNFYNNLQIGKIVNNLGAEKL